MGRKLYALSVLTHTSLRRLGAIDIHRVNPGRTEHQSVSAIPHRQQGEVCSRCGWSNGIHCHLLLNSAEQHGAERSYRLLVPWSVLPRNEGIRTLRDVQGHSPGRSYKRGQKQPLYSEPIGVKLFSIRSYIQCHTAHLYIAYEQDWKIPVPWHCTFKVSIQRLSQSPRIASSLDVHVHWIWRG